MVPVVVVGMISAAVAVRPVAFALCWKVPEVAQIAASAGIVEPHCCHSCRLACHSLVYSMLLDKVIDAQIFILSNADL